MTDHVPTVISVNISPGGIPKTPIPRGSVTRDGIAGDGHDHEKHNTPMQALSLLDVEDLDDLRAEGFAVLPGATGENVTLRGLDVDALEVGDHIAFSGGVRVELTKRRNPCYVLDAISPELKKVIVGRCGFYAKVLATGTIAAGETLTVTRAAAAAAAGGA